MPPRGCYFEARWTRLWTELLLSEWSALWSDPDRRSRCRLIVALWLARRPHSGQYESRPRAARRVARYGMQHSAHTLMALFPTTFANINTASAPARPPTWTTGRSTPCSRAGAIRTPPQRSH